MLDKPLLTEHLTSPSPMASLNGGGQVAARSGLIGVSDSPTCGTLPPSPPMPSLLHRGVFELAQISWVLKWLL